MARSRPDNGSLVRAPEVIGEGTAAQIVMAFDVTRHEVMPALELLVEAFEHPARLLAGFARAFDRDLIAARVGNDPEPALDRG